jgi:hypothetical protein
MDMYTDILPAKIEMTVKEVLRIFALLIFLKIFEERFVIYNPFLTACACIKPKSQDFAGSNSRKSPVERCTFVFLPLNSRI